MTKKSCLNFFLFIFILLGSSGCAVNTNINKYNLNGSCIRTNCCHSCYTLLVAEATAVAGYDTDEMIYVQCPYQLKAFSRNRWVAPPHVMLTSLLAQSLRNTAYFKAVVTPPFSGEVNYRVESRLIKLQHEFMCCPSRIHMIFQVVLIDNNENKIIAEKLFGKIVLAPKNNPYGGVIAANKATRQILQEVAGFIICTIEQHPCVPKTIIPSIDPKDAEVKKIPKEATNED